MTQNCPINEQTGDGVPVGRCYYHLADGKTCPRHGDVAPEVQHFVETGNLALENDLRRRRGEPVLGEHALQRNTMCPNPAVTDLDRPRCSRCGVRKAPEELNGDDPLAPIGQRYRHAYCVRVAEGKSDEAREHLESALSALKCGNLM